MGDTFAALNKINDIEVGFFFFFFFFQFRHCKIYHVDANRLPVLQLQE